MNARLDILTLWSCRCHFQSHQFRNAIIIDLQDISYYIYIRWNGLYVHHWWSSPVRVMDSHRRESKLGPLDQHGFYIYINWKKKNRCEGHTGRAHEDQIRDLLTSSDNWLYFTALNLLYLGKNHFPICTEFGRLLRSFGAFGLHS